ncbi:hypothetical protein BP5796_02137 [Coleophoma crateriformis]|uniref:AAA+ ATPase domain-containing protein n=1 Tax=Coleophoma crateriformis TaxID=565419 RepID=A0A3D8SXC4_9HELO|nr:hypothetical protein BP5796_02137 [Coleophoma crateriformis]
MASQYYVADTDNEAVDIINPYVQQRFEAGDLSRSDDGRSGYDSRGQNYQYYENNAGVTAAFDDQQARAPRLMPEPGSGLWQPGALPVNSFDINTAPTRLKMAVPMTISDDRTTGSEYDATGRCLAALKHSEKKQPHLQSSASYGGTFVRGPPPPPPAPTIRPLPPGVRPPLPAAAVQPLDPSKDRFWEPSSSSANHQISSSGNFKRANDVSYRVPKQFDDTIGESYSKTKRVLRTTKSLHLAYNRMSMEMKRFFNHSRQATIKAKSPVAYSQEAISSAFEGEDSFWDEIKHFGIPDNIALDRESIQAYIADLQHKAMKLDEVAQISFEVIHQIYYKDDKKARDMMYFDPPQWTIGSDGSRYLEIVFLVYKDYDAAAIEKDGPVYDDDGVVPFVLHTSESIFINTNELSDAVASLLARNKASPDELAAFNRKKLMFAPYLYIFFSRPVLEEFLDALPDQQPGEVLVQGRDQTLRAVQSVSWLRELPAFPSKKVQRAENGKKMRRMEVEAFSWTLYEFFARERQTVSLEMDMNDHSPKNIRDLDLRPLRFAGDEVAGILRRRGEMFWKCRVGHLVSYHEDKDRDDHHAGDDRYMIDLKTHRKLHKSDEIFTEQLISTQHLDSNLADNLDPPEGNFIYLLPPTIKGFHMKKKKWLDLQVDRICEVVWNKEAFKSLVLDPKTKDLIEALIRNQLEAENATDLICGKGNGLILLLHGGPGTGKTLSPESVAEIAEKPLYPVTCGDIGTEPEHVEKYLEAALDLGKTWAAVVLLDEADVFLEQRSLEDLRRNALVSVFLRVLEYYDGILILTSNRVGTFDEAFKSRIQLALHYANLTSFQRTKIWRNFFNRLKKLGEEKIDFSDLHDHIEQLSQNKMNGRQIRNAITTARQYAKWKNETLTYVLLKDIIDTAGRFDVYIEKLNGGYSQDQLAEDEGLRLAKAL